LLGEGKGKTSAFIQAGKVNLAFQEFPNRNTK